MISRNRSGRPDNRSNWPKAVGNRRVREVLPGRRNANSGRSCRNIGGRRLEDVAVQAGLFLRGVSRLDDRSGQCADAHHGGAGGGLIVQTSNLSRVSGACRNASKPVQTPVCIRPGVVRPVEVRRQSPGLPSDSADQKKCPCGGCRASPWWEILCYLCIVANADVTVNLGLRQSATMSLPWTAKCLPHRRLRLSVTVPYGSPRVAAGRSA